MNWFVIIKQGLAAVYRYTLSDYNVRLEELFKL